MKIRSKRGGSGLIETIMAAVVLVPIALLLVDLTVIIIGNSINDTAAKNAARAGANQTDGGLAFAAAQLSLKTFKPSPIVSSLSISTFDYSVPNGNVTCKTQVVVKLPVPFPGCSSLTFDTQDVEPILAQQQQ